MNIEQLSHLMPELTPEDLNKISSKSLNDYFILRHFSGEEIFISKSDCLYIVQEGRVVITGFIEDNLEVTMEFQEGDCIGHLELLIDKPLDIILKGMPSATVLEVPMIRMMDSIDVQSLTGLNNILNRAIVKNALKLIKKHAAKVNFSNEQYVIDFLISNGGEITYTSNEDLIQLLHIEIRTLQRIIKKLIEGKILEKNGKTLRIIDMVSAREILEN